MDERREALGELFREVGHPAAAGKVCVSYRTSAELDGTIVVDLDAPAQVTPGQTFTITVRDVSVVGVTTGGEEGPQYPNGILSVVGAATPTGDVTVGEDVLSGGDPLPNTLTYTATGDPGDAITVGVQMAQSFYGDFLFGDRYTCGGQGRQVASIPVVAPPS